MRRFSFLSVFLTTLSIAFAIAVFVRIRSYSKMETTTGTLEQVTTAGGEAVVPLTVAPATPQPPAWMETATIVDAQKTAQTRAQRREQLLREAQQAAQNPQPAAPQPVAPKPVQKPSVVARLIAPVVKAITGSSTRPAPAPRNPQPPVQPQPRASSPSAQPATSTEPKDPNSDTIPPQLMGIEFDPPQVHDGEEARVILTATDDLSGVRGISGTVTSPTGKALQGFAGQREADTNRFVGRLTIPKNGEEGLWRVNIITMSDNASNSVTLSQAQGTVPPTAVLRVVSSQSDSVAPTLKAVRPQKRSMQVGEPNPVYIEAEDDKSGVNLVSAVFQSPNKKARIGAGCRRGDAEVWTCELSLPACIDCGDWQLEQVTLQDKANNLATFRTDNPIVQEVKINIGGDSCDSEPPRLGTLALDQNVVTLAAQAAVVTVTITASDDACGVSGVSGQFTGPGSGTGGFFPFQQAGDPSTWVGRIPLDPRAPRGAWKINSIQLTDKGHNLKIYYGNDPLLANGTFQVR